MKRTRLVPVNEYGHRINEGHHNSRVPQVIVNRIRELREDEGWSYGAIARELGLKRSYVQKVANYQLRAQVAHDWRRVPVANDNEASGQAT